MNSLQRQVEKVNAWRKGWSVGVSTDKFYLKTAQVKFVLNIILNAGKLVTFSNYCSKVTNSLNKATRIRINFCKNSL